MGKVLSPSKKMGLEVRWDMVHGCRDEIADCSERAYISLSISDAKMLMLFKSDQEAAGYAAQVVAPPVFQCRWYGSSEYVGLAPDGGLLRDFICAALAEKLGCAGWIDSLPGWRGEADHQPSACGAD